MNMKNCGLKLCLAGLAVVLSVCCRAADVAAPCARDAKKPLKVLMIGNSFSICALKYMPPVAASLDLPLDLCSLYIGGCSLRRHAGNVRTPEKAPYFVSWNYVSETEGKPAPFVSVLTKNKDGKWHGNIPAMLAADKWDVVTIQQASHESWNPKCYEPYGTELLATIRKLAPQAKVYVQQTWSYTPWDKRLKRWGFDQNAMFDKLEAAYAEFAARHKIDQILTGKAVQRYRKELPVVYTEKSNDDDVCGTRRFVEKDGKWEPKGDVFHFNDQGEFLQALVWTAGAALRRGRHEIGVSSEVPRRAARTRRADAEDRDRTALSVRPTKAVVLPRRSVGRARHPCRAVCDVIQCAAS